MVRRLWQNRLVQAVLRLIRIFLRWVLVWLSYLTRRVGRNLRVFRHMLVLLVRPQNPNNLYLDRPEAAHEAAEMGYGSVGTDLDSPAGGALLWASKGRADGTKPETLDTTTFTLWRGEQKRTAETAESSSTAVNRRYAYLDVLATQLKSMSAADISLLDELVERLARKWLDIDESFERLPRRNRLDVGETLRYNIPRYAGRILNFRWAVKERPIPRLSKPARILIIGDVSHSMVHYMTVALYFMHKLNFRFTVDSWVFSEHATHAAPFLKGMGSFEEKMARLAGGARSWNAGTRFGTALEEIAEQAVVDEYTYVIVAGDGKVSLQGDEPAKIERYMGALRHRAKSVVYLTPSAEFSQGAAGKLRPNQLGSLRTGFLDIPIFESSPVLWYGVLGKYADRIYLVKTVQDLVDMTEDLILSSRD